MYSLLGLQISQCGHLARHGSQELRLFSLLSSSRKASSHIQLLKSIANKQSRQPSQPSKQLEQPRKQPDKKPLSLKSSEIVLSSQSERTTSPLVNTSPHKERTFEELYSLYKRINSKDRVLLSTTLTPELEAEIRNANPDRAFMLQQVKEEIIGQEQKEKPLFPLPESLTLYEWSTLISFDNDRTWLKYLLALLSGNVDVEALRAEDKIYSNPLRISEERIAAIHGDNQEARDAIGVFTMHHEIQRQEGNRVSYVLRDIDIESIGKLDSEKAHFSYLRYLYKNEIVALVSQLRQDYADLFEAVVKTIEEEEAAAEKHIFYAIGYNSIYHRVYDVEFKKLGHWNAIREFNSWGIPLVIDMSMDASGLSRGDAFARVRQLTSSIVANRNHVSPYQLHVTGLQEDTELLEIFKSFYKSSHDPPANLTSESHLDLFPKERLVYLSPDSTNELSTLNPDDIYVLGGMEKYGMKSQSIPTAKRLKVRHARLPMKRVIGLNANLNINHCVSILCDMKAHEDWFYAFRWVPTRFFENRLKSHNKPDSVLHQEHILAFRAHYCLSPLNHRDPARCVRNQALTPAKYRLYHRRIRAAESIQEMEAILDELKI